MKKSNENWEQVKVVSQALDYGLFDIAHKIHCLIKADAWRSFVNPMGREMKYDNFVDFVEARVLDGLDSDLETIKRVCSGKNNRDTLDLIDKVTRGKHGGDRKSKIKSDNITLDSNPRGTSIEGALRRLRKDRPDLHAEVLADNLSAHAAMVAAGFRPKTATVRLDDPERLAQSLIHKLGDKRAQDLARRILEALAGDAL